MSDPLSVPCDRVACGACAGEPCRSIPSADGSGDLELTVARFHQVRLWRARGRCYVCHTAAVDAHCARAGCPGVRRDREANLDGELHVLRECCGPGRATYRACSTCGGHLHRQPTHGGILEVCESCPGDADHWRPRGTYLTEAMVDGQGVTGSFVTGEAERPDPAAGSS